MSKRGLLITGIVAAVATGGAFASQEHWLPLVSAAHGQIKALAEQGHPSQAGSPPSQRQGEERKGGRPVPVETAVAQRADVPLRLDALGTVQPIASVAVKSRVETTIVGVHFADGALVKAGDVLFTLDSRSVEAQIRQVEGVLAGAEAQLEQAQRDLQRYTDLLAKSATTQVTVSNATTQVNILRATVTSSKANLDNLRVQLDHHTIRAPISGRISAAAVKLGNFVRPADTSPLATIVQTKPVYVTFGLPQRSLPAVRRAISDGSSRVEALAPGEGEPAVGRLAMIDNTVDATTGMISVRALMDNADEQLWPGSLVRVGLVLKVEQAVTIPSAAVQTGQDGTFVFVIKDGVAFVQRVSVERTFEGRSVIANGLAGGETVVTDGQLLLAQGTPVAPRQRRAGS